jgi:hypothetical protein
MWRSLGEQDATCTTHNSGARGEAIRKGELRGSVHFFSAHCRRCQGDCCVLGGHDSLLERVHELKKLLVFEWKSCALAARACDARLATALGHGLIRNSHITLACVSCVILCTTLRQDRMHLRTHTSLGAARGGGKHTTCKRSENNGGSGWGMCGWAGAKSRTENAPLDNKRSCESE